MKSKNTPCVCLDLGHPLCCSEDLETIVVPPRTGSFLPSGRQGLGIGLAGVSRSRGWGPFLSVCPLVARVLVVTPRRQFELLELMGTGIRPLGLWSQSSRRRGRKGPAGRNSLPCPAFTGPRAAWATQLLCTCVVAPHARWEASNSRVCAHCHRVSSHTCAGSATGPGWGVAAPMVSVPWCSKMPSSHSATDPARNS